MADAGVEILVPYHDVAVMGLTDVVLHSRNILRTFRHLTQAMDTHRPALVVLIDFPDFNIRLGRRARRRGIPVVYFISPQVWAWRRHRLRALRQIVHKMLVIFPFEEPLYREAGIDATYVGHPLLDRLEGIPAPEEARRRLGVPLAGPLLALLPGSRRGEVSRHLPVMLAAAGRLVAEDAPLAVVVAVAEGVPLPLVEAIVAGYPFPVRLVEGRTYETLRAADVSLVVSGTATLEAALLGAPMVITYRTSLLSYAMARLLVRVPFIGMANLVAGRRIVPELIQSEVTPGRLAAAARSLFKDARAREAMQAGFREVRARLGAPGAPARAAREILGVLRHAPSAGGC
jgi:lipid-A-disaccharide synthase